MHNNPFKNIKPWFSKHEPKIFLGLGIIGLIASTGLGIWGTFKSNKVCKKYKEDHNLEKITPKEAFKLCYKYYIPVTISMAASIACLVTGNHVSSFRYAAAVTAYTSSEMALQELKEATKEVVGPKKVKEIQEVANAKKIEETYKGDTQIIMTGDGDSLFYEPLSGRYFKSNWNKIKSSANDLNGSALCSMGGFITLNDWFRRLGLEETDIGNMIGWDLAGNPNNLIRIDISSHMTKDKVPCGAISYKSRPDKLKFSAI